MKARSHKDLEECCSFETLAGWLPTLLAMGDLLLIVNAGQGEEGRASKKRAKNKKN